MAGAGVTFVVEEGIKPSGPGSYGKDPNRMREPERKEKYRKKGAGNLEDAWAELGKGKVEAMSSEPAGTVAVVTKQNLLVKAVHAAYYDHHPFVLSPDVIWLTIAQGVANHVAQNPEALRSSFVTHEGKKDLVVERPEFVNGSKDNDWEGVFPEFVEQIEANTVLGAVDRVTASFSTTGPVEKVAGAITLMDIVQHYFTYTMGGGCGIPSIRLKGTPGDWELLRAKAGALRKYDGLGFWLDVLEPVLDEFVVASRGKPNLDFWRSVCVRC